MANEKGTIIGARSHGRTPPGTPTLRQLWKASQARGDHTYDPGIPCVRGHVSLRWTQSGICIACKRENDIAYNSRNVKAHRERSRKSAQSRPDEVKAYRKKYYRANEEEAKTRAREWALAHPEHVRERYRRWYKKNTGHIRAQQAAWVASNKDMVRISRKKWKLKNPDKLREADALRRARELGSQTGDRKVYRAYIKWTRVKPSIPCYWCQKTTKPGKKTRNIDHIIPLAKGGADTVANLCVACPPCNRRKNAKLPEDFAGQSELRFA